MVSTLQTQSTLLRLRPFEAGDLSSVIRWRNDSELRDSVLWSLEPFGEEAAARWLKAVTENPDTVTFAIELLQGDRLVGQTNLSRIDRISGTSYFGIVIGERDCRRKGLGQETLRLMAAQAAQLGLRKLLLEVADFNKAAIELYIRFGFSTEGVLKAQTFRNGQYHDLFIMSYFL